MLRPAILAEMDLLSATNSLKEDHRRIERAPGALSFISERLVLAGHVSAEIVSTILDFIVNFVDKSHRGKEVRNLLFF